MLQFLYQNTNLNIIKFTSYLCYIIYFIIIVSVCQLMLSAFSRYFDCNYVDNHAKIVDITDGRCLYSYH